MAVGCVSACCIDQTLGFVDWFSFNATPTGSHTWQKHSPRKGRPTMKLGVLVGGLAAAILSVGASLS